MGKEKDFLLAEKCELERIIAEIPEESVLDKLSFEARLKKVNEDLSNLEKSEEIKEPDDSMFGRLAQIEAQIMELRGKAVDDGRCVPQAGKTVFREDGTG